MLVRSLALPIQHTLMNWIVFGGISAVAISYVILLTLDQVAAQNFASEDSLIENLGAVLCLVAVFLFLIAYFESATEHNQFFGRTTSRNVWLLLLALLMFLCFGEEISWGQRIFGWETPSTVTALNAQNETNIHNLWLFQAKRPDGSPKTALELMLNSNRLLSIIWLVYCVVIPLVVNASARAKQITSFVGFPIPGSAVGAVFIMNFVMFHFIITLGSMDRHTVAAFNELKETNYEFAFVLLAVCALVQVAPTIPHRESAQDAPQNRQAVA